ncbi:MAG TPA: Calx-beta domain-containing protein, partial [Pyrinomonadaceae bacterium]|nr:Calx-beta domain-containing protein [Pyrinomonadaceae bacterium]
PAAPGGTAGALFPLPLGQLNDFEIKLSPQHVTDLKAGLHYINVHTSNFMSGEIRGQFGPSPASSIVVSGASSFSVNEGQGAVPVTFTRLGNTAVAASVSFATSDTAGLTNCNVINGVASSRCDYVASVSSVTFGAGESSKTISIPIVDDGYAEGSETFTISLHNPSGLVLGPPTSAIIIINDNDTVNGQNPIDQTAFFVRQHYVDFLGREPDPAGFSGWQNIINSCPPGDITCDRVHVSGSFFQSPEFQQRGYFVYRFYPVSFGRKPDYDEFIPDLARVSGFLTDAQLEAAKLAFIAEFMSRPAFITKFNGLDDTQYVDTLLTTAGVTSASRNLWIAALTNGTLTRAQVLREIAESSEVNAKYYNQAFVVMQYFGYLRREPDALYLNWIQELDESGNPRNMINGFVNSLEYRLRFGP